MFEGRIDRSVCHMAPTRLMTGDTTSRPCAVKPYCSTRVDRIFSNARSSRLIIDAIKALNMRRLVGGVDRYVERDITDLLFAQPGYLRRFYAMPVEHGDIQQEFRSSSS